ncbi:MAG: exo-alpha-sialidase [Candidatus Viridilinea halotolerans]|uniref:Exo-alpha-sialidase n=1 Tax=Candidatus Viridilinea halotolerans TaxID=2491704 RepID=A0A426TYQ4_9CHLR|nr:MAG: exo-alpha-sialidase [Candidatus Viridilinea halotolerans]
MRKWLSGKVDYSVAAVLLIVLAVVDVLVITAFWNTPVNVSNDASISDRPALAVDGSGLLHLVWADSTTGYAGSSEILYRSSSDGGATWGPAAPVNLSNSAARSLQPKIAAAGTQRVVAWVDGNNTVVMRWGESAWTTPFALSNSTTPTRRISVAINEAGVALVAWTEGFGSVEGYVAANVPNERGFYRRWNGSVWSEAQPVAARLVAMRGDLAYLATERGTLLRSSDAGATWGTPINLPASYGPPADMKLDSLGTLHMAWHSNNAVMVGSYNGNNFSQPALVDSWPQLPTTASSSHMRDQLGIVTALALAINPADHLGLVWAAPSLEGVTTGYRPQGVNNLGAEASYRIMSSQSFDGRTWTTPTLQGVEGGFPALAAAPEGSRFYGAWRSLGSTPDVHVAVNQPDQAGYRETFDRHGRLFAKGINIGDGTAKLNSSSPLDWPLFGASQNYGRILRGQEGATTLMLLDNTCLTSFNSTTGEVSPFGGSACLPTYEYVYSSQWFSYTMTERMAFVDGLVQGENTYILATTRAFSNSTNIVIPHLLRWNGETSSFSDLGQPTGLPQNFSLAPNNSMAATPDGAAIYVVLDNQLYRYNVANGTWENLNQAARAVAIARDGTIYIGHEQNLLSSPNGSNFTQRASDFSTQLLHIDPNGCVVGGASNQPLTGFQPANGNVVRSSSNITALWYPNNAFTNGSDGAAYLINPGLSLGGALASFRCSDGTLTEVFQLAELNPYGSGSGGLVVASDNRLWMSVRRATYGMADPNNPTNPSFDGLVAYPLTPLRGEVVSPPIFSGSGGVEWGTLTFSVTVPAGASFAVDVLDLAGNVLREDVASGASLAALPAAPVRLRGRMAATNANASPVLSQWQLTWNPRERREARLGANLPLELNLANGAVKLNFPAGAVQAEHTLTYSELVTPTQSLGNFRFAGRSFTVVATKADGTITREFNARFSIIVNYTDAELAAAGISEDDLDLVFWNGSRWVSTNPTLDRANKRLVTTLDHLTEFALVGQGTQTVYLPLVRR